MRSAGLLLLVASALLVYCSWGVYGATAGIDTVGTAEEEATDLWITEASGAFEVFIDDLEDDHYVYICPPTPEDGVRVVCSPDTIRSGPDSYFMEITTGSGDPSTATYTTEEGVRSQIFSWSGVDATFATDRDSNCVRMQLELRAESEVTTACTLQCSYQAALPSFTASPAVGTVVDFRRDTYYLYTQETGSFEGDESEDSTHLLCPGTESVRLTCTSPALYETLYIMPVGCIDGVPSAEGEPYYEVESFHECDMSFSITWPSTEVDETCIYVRLEPGMACAYAGSDPTPTPDPDPSLPLWVVLVLVLVCVAAVGVGGWCVVRRSRTKAPEETCKGLARGPSSRQTVAVV
ncbi:hypothetical protein KIPB_010989 [Kipferlia bialata]|uniref:Uncharacterized protein n=1 Tax=Kipferlia bialata TaxID=797122 RepID=A0A391NWU5_9EUKA|nr:hypothetical protein KIPB_010989 [Kipferlia bialata]|eukprot:g10989.t1